MSEPALFSFESRAEGSDVHVFQFLDWQTWGVRVDVLRPVRLHEVPRLDYFVQLVSASDVVFDSVVQENDFFDFDCEVVFVRERVGEHDAWTDAHGRDDEVLDDEVGDVSASSDVEQNYLGLRNAQQYLFGL